MRIGGSANYAASPETCIDTEINHGTHVPQGDPLRDPFRRSPNAIAMGMEAGWSPTADLTTYLTFFSTERYTCSAQGFSLFSYF
jgi:hypothetical protein